MKNHASLMGFLCTAWLVGLTSTAQAVTPQDFRSGREDIRRSSISRPSSLGYGDPADYQIGSQFGKHPVTSPELSRETNAFKRTVKFTAHVGGATGFFLGRFNDELVMATNHHVIPDASRCRGTKVEFKNLKIRTECERGLGSWPEIDLALFTIRADTARQASALEAVAQNFNFGAAPEAGTDLMTMGFGVAGNPMTKLMANKDSDCQVFSRPGDIRLMADPDQYNPASYKAWSFAIGCEVSHGDSGSAIVDRNTGAVIGIVWTGAIPKKGDVQNSSKIQQWLRANDAKIWKELTLAVPASKIHEYLNAYVKSKPRIPSADLKLIAAVVR